MREMQGGAAFARASHAGRDGVCQWRDGSQHTSDAASRGEGAASNPLSVEVERGVMGRDVFSAKKATLSRKHFEPKFRSRKGTAKNSFFLGMQCWAQRAQQPQCTPCYMRIASTMQRRHARRGQARFGIFGVTGHEARRKG